MRRDDFVDFFAVRDDHLAIHDRLEAWARWVNPRQQGWHMQPMFRQYRSHAWQWEAPVIHAPLNAHECLEIERAVSLLPEKHRTAIRWCYVFKGFPVKMARQLGVSREGLMDLVQSARTMVKNRSAG